MSIDTFLSQAALVVPSSTSAHLLTAHSQLLHEASKPLNVKQKRDYCGACGSIRKPEWTKVTEIKPKKIQPVATSISKGATVYKCLRCRRRTVLPPKQIPAKPSAAKASPTLKAQVSDPKSGDNQNSKKRAKARKNGLQALLASKQQAQPSLDLLDFLQ